MYNIEAMTKLFSDIVGQKLAVSILSSQLNSDQLSHAYVFLGDEGTGKEFLAREFAKYILCENIHKEKGESCARVEKGTHPDFIIVRGEEGIKIEEVREVIEKVNLHPILSKKKVLLFTKAENLGLEAANALLKTLEEPPADSVLILTAISEKSLLPTILSRAQKIRLGKIGSKEMQTILSKDFSQKEIEKILPLAEGSIGEAKRLLTDQKYFDSKLELLSQIEQVLVSSSVVERFKILEDIDKKKQIKDFLDVFGRIVFQSLYIGINGQESDYFNEICGKVIKKYQKEQISEIGEKILKIYQNLEYNVNSRLAIEEIILATLR